MLCLTYFVAECSSYYFKGRTDSQPTVNEFPPHAWGQQPNLSEQTDTNVSHIMGGGLPSHYQSDTDLTRNMVDNSETASDSGGPRSILKRRGGSNLARSHSTPSIRDSLEIAKEHMGGSRSGVAGLPPKVRKALCYLGHSVM